MRTTRSKFITALMATGMAASVADAQTYSYTPGGYEQAYTAPPVPAYTAPTAPTLNADQLRQLLAPIALYPDPLLTEVLAGATYPQDIVAAQRWLQYFPYPTEDNINAQPWDPSVKTLVHYPTVLAMMARQPDWTAALGVAFANQPQDVMNTVQQLRAEAQAANALASTPQQQVINDNGVIEIVPAQPNVIYVPQYDPTVVYLQQPYYSSVPLITFGPAFGIGVWLDLDWDWHRHHVNEGVRWDRDWHHPDFDHVREWRHNPERPIFVPHDYGHDFHGDPHRHDRCPGWDPAPQHPPVFDTHGARVDERSHAPERPVNGIPNRPEPPRAEARPVEPPRAVTPARPIEPARPAEPPRNPPPQQGRGATHVQANERPVEGITHAAPAPTPSHPEERAPVTGSAHVAPPPSAFHSEGGGAAVQAGRGHGSMGH